MHRDRQLGEENHGAPSGAASTPADQLAQWQTYVQLDRWKAGDPAAFEALHARFAPLLRSRIRRSRVWPLLDRHMQIDDVAQEIWGRAVPAAKQGFTDSGPGSFLAFLGKIADRTMIDLARTQQARKRGRGGAKPATPTAFDDLATRGLGRASVETPTSHARASELQDLARTELSQREYEAWDLVELQQFSAEEAGLAMRCSGSAVRGLLLRSRARLVTRISPQRTD